MSSQPVRAESYLPHTNLQMPYLAPAHDPVRRVSESHVLKAGQNKVTRGRRQRAELTLLKE